MNASSALSHFAGRAAAWLLCGLAAAGCGSRDGLGTDAPDASRPGAPVTVDCGRSTQYTAPRQTLELLATVDGYLGAAREEAS